jgi:hypothetical protein
MFRGIGYSTVWSACIGLVSRINRPRNFRPVIGHPVIGRPMICISRIVRSKLCYTQIGRPKNSLLDWNKYHRQFLCKFFFR